MQQEELDKILKLHNLWLAGDASGVRANLSGANLSEADLFGTSLEGKAMLTFQFERHTAYFFGTDEITIGCHRKTIAYWLENYVEIGKQEGYTDEQIKMYGNFIKQCAVLFENKE